jgi:nucleoside-triphosphatase THEP1
MELHSTKFKEAVLVATDSQKLLIGVIHWKVTDPFLTRIKDRDDAETRVVTAENREKMPVLVTGEAIKFLSGTARNKGL